MSLFEYILLAGSSLFVIIDPLALVPVFLAMTPGDSAAERARAAKLACTLAASVLVVFALVGQRIFQFLGITLPAFQMAGSVILLMIALDMLRAHPSETRESPEEKQAGAAKDDIAITPLGVPLLAGPGAISNVIILESKAHHLSQQLALYGCILAICAASYLILRLSAQGARLINPIAMKIATRLMGLLLAAIAFQFLINALTALKGTLF
jgi:multiple antibiotic resistance protein